MDKQKGKIEFELGYLFKDMGAFICEKMRESH